MIEAPEKIEWQVVRIEAPLPELLEIGTTEYSRVALGAAMLLERDGWCKYNSVTDLGQRCTSFALGEAARMGSLSCAQFEISGELTTFIRDGKPGHSWYPHIASWWYPHIASWNDSPYRTYEEVIDTLLAFAAKEDRDARGA